MNTAMLAKVPAWALAGVVAVSTPITGWLLNDKMNSQNEKMAVLQRGQEKQAEAIEAVMKVVGNQQTAIEVLRAQTLSQDKFYQQALENQRQTIRELQLMRNGKPHEAP